MSDWREFTLEKIASPGRYSVVGGPFGSALGRKDYVAQGVPVIRGAQLGGPGPFSHDDLVYVSEAKATRHVGNLAYPGDLLVTQRGTVGQVGLIPDDAPFGRYLLSQSQMKLTVDPSRAERRFVYYWLRSPEAQNAMNGSTISAGVPHINLATFKALKIRMPSLDIQARIARILGSLDDLIENNRRRVEVLDGMARAIYREWFLHFRYPGHQRANFVGSQPGPTPEGWELVPLSDLADITMGQSPSSDHYNTEGVGSPFHQGVTDFGAHYPTTRKWCAVPGRSAQDSDILVSVRAPVGRINVADVDMTIGRGLAALRAKDNRQALLLGHLRHAFAEEDSMGGGTIFKAIGKDELASIKVFQLPIELAERADDMFASNLALIRDLTHASQRLTAMRDQLLPKLVTGQINVSGLPSDLPLDGAVA